MSKVKVTITRTDGRTMKIEGATDAYHDDRGFFLVRNLVRTWIFPEHSVLVFTYENVS